MAIPNAPTSMDEFNQMAQSFIQKAKAQGIPDDDMGIGNTLKFMYQMTQDNIKQQESQMMTPYQQEQTDLDREKFEYAKNNPNVTTQIITDKNGNQQLINSETGEVISGYGAEGSTEDFESSFSPQAVGATPKENVGYNQAGKPVMSLDPGSLANDFQPSSTQVTQNTPQMGMNPSQNLEQVNQSVFNDQGQEITGSGQGWYSYNDPNKGSTLYINKDIGSNIAGKAKSALGAGAEFLKRGLIPLYNARKEGYQG